MEVRQRGKGEDEESVTEERGGVKGDGRVESPWTEKKAKSEAGKAQQTGNKQHRMVLPQHKHMTTHTYTHIVSDTTQTNKHQAFQLCMLCSLLPLIHTRTHTLLFHSPSGIHIFPIHNSAVLTHLIHALQSMLRRIIKVTQEQKINNDVQYEQCLFCSSSDVDVVWVF